MGLDWRLSFKTEAGEYVDVPHTWPEAPSRYYGPLYEDNHGYETGWCEVGAWPVIQEMILNATQEYKSPIYYGNDEDEPVLVTPELLAEINKHFMKGKK